MRENYFWLKPNNCRKCSFFYISGTKPDPKLKLGLRLLISVRKLASSRKVDTVRTFAGVGFAASCGRPGQVVVELLASLAVQTHRVVRTLTFAVHLHNANIHKRV